MRSAVEGEVVEEILAYLRDAIERPQSVQRWPEWWAVNAERVRQVFDHADYVRLKFRRLDAARTILARIGRPAVEPPEVGWLDRAHCPHCGEPLMRFLPGEGPTREQVVAFGHRSGIEQCQQGYWLHPGVYCPLGCIQILMEFRQPEQRHPGPQAGEGTAHGESCGEPAPATPTPL